MSEDGNVKPEMVDTALGDMKLDESSNSNGSVPDGRETDDPLGVEPASASMKEFHSPTPQSLQQPYFKKQSASQTPKSVEDEEQETLGGEVTVKLENGKPPKLSRKASQKVISRPAPLFDHLENSTLEAVSAFQVIRDCIYGSKYMGASEHDALGCDCSEELDGDVNHACGEDSDCINRATKMECIDDECNCGLNCQNQRFQRKEYANVSVIKTEKKGYGLRTDSDLQANDFIFEYVGEVINEPTFRRRTIQYDEEGIKHFYFMSLTKSEFVDATKKGNLGRFCNHSCNPNCYVDKWVVGDKLRMGIFAERNIKAGEELVFNYNVDRYGADPQPCYCAEPNCTGFIGGKTQTERATKLSHATIEALGIDDGDGWDTAVAKKPRKKKTGEDDEEYVNNLQPKGLDEDGVTKVMATLMQCKEKWIAVKLLSRIQLCDDDRVRNRVVRMHGYQILRTTLTTWQEDNNVVLQILDILYKFPRLTRNKITDSKIESAIEPLKSSEHEDVTFEATRLLEEWSTLEVAYRIPRKKFDPNAQSLFDRRESNKEEPVVSSPAHKATVAPTGPRSTMPQRNKQFFAPQRSAIPRRTFSALPTGWFTALDPNGNTYYYSKGGQTTWQRPQLPAPEILAPPKAPPKAVANQKALQDIIDSITKVDTNTRTPSSGTPQPVETPSKEKKQGTEKWRTMSQEKQMKLYENTLFPHIKYVMDKFRHKLPKDDLKKFAKEIGKKLVASDFKNNRVEDPTRISSKQEKKVKKYVKEFFDKCVAKKAEHDKKRKAEKATSALTNGSTSNGGNKGATASPDIEAKAGESDVAEMSDDEPGSPPGHLAASVPATPFGSTSEDNLKRKLDDISHNEGYDSAPGDAPLKRIKDEDDGSDEPSPPPPPPPPPAGDMPEASMDMEMTEEDREMAEQEAALMRENEEALMKENEEAMREALAKGEEVPEPIPGSIDEVDVKTEGVNLRDENATDIKMEDANGNGLRTEPLATEAKSVDDKENFDALQHERKHLLSH